MFSLNLCTDGKGAIVSFDDEGNLKKYTVAAEGGKYKIKNEEVLLSNSELIIPEGMRINGLSKMSVTRDRLTDQGKER